MTVESVLAVTPPHDLDMERAFLSCAIQSGDTARVATGLLSADDFYLTLHRDIYTAIRRHLKEHGTAPDVPMLVHMLEDKYENVRRSIGELFGISAECCRIVEYGMVLRRAARLREALSACGRYCEAIQADWRNQEPLATLQQRVEAASVEAGGCDILEEGTEEYIAELRKRVARCHGKAMPGIPTGFPLIDAATSGLTPGLWCLGGWSTVGKSSIICSILQAASRANYKSLTYSLDMSANTFRDRLISSIHNIHDGKLRSGNMTEIQLERAERAAVDLMSMGIQLYGKSLSIGHLEAHAIRNRERYDLLVVDTLQRVGIDGQFKSGYDRCCEVVGRVKDLAKKLDVPILLACQAKDPPDRRETATKTIRRPNLNDLEGARRITQEAAGVLMVWRGSYGDPMSDNTEAELALAKNQTGRTAKQPLTWDKLRGVFVEQREDYATITRSSDD